MISISEPEREIPVALNVDVAVVGAGTAGFPAALAAARNGAKTLLIERYGFLGGTAAASGLNVFLGFFAKDKQVVRGIAQEIIDRMIERGGSLGHQRRPECEDCTSEKNCRAGSVRSFAIYDPEVFKYVVLTMATESGVELLLHSFAVRPIIEGKCIKGVIIENKSGRQAILAKIVVDATGDGDIAFRAGAPTEKGRSEDSVLQTPSLVFKIGGVNRNDKRIRVYSDELKQRFWIYRLPRPGYYSVNTDCPPTKGFTNFDATDAKSLTYGEVITRTSIYKAIDFLQKNIKGFEGGYLVTSPPFLGIRETRRILGEYVLCTNDILKKRRFRDVIALGVHNLDIHDPLGVEPSKGGSLNCNEYYHIPYRCLIPLEIDNLLVAGRCISTTHEANGSIRVMATCMALGQAAGTAAAISVRSGLSPRQVDVPLLQKILRKQDAVL